MALPTAWFDTLLRQGRALPRRILWLTPLPPAPLRGHVAMHCWLIGRFGEFGFWMAPILAPRGPCGTYGKPLGSLWKGLEGIWEAPGALRGLWEAPEGQN